MSYTGSPAQVWSVMKNVGMEKEARLFAATMESVFYEFAKPLADKLGIECKMSGMDGHEVGGLLVSFGPAKNDDPVPAAFLKERMDDEDSWEPL